MTGSPPSTRAPVSGAPAAHRRGGKGGVLDLALTLLVAAVLVFGVVRPFVVEPLYVPTGSMVPTLEPGDRILANKFVYRFSKPERGDVVVFRNGGEDLVKRVVGLPGDKVAVWDGVLFIDGERVREPYVDYGLADSTFFGPERVPEGRLFVMGDNRANSLDSRSFGPVPEGDLLGEVVLRLWPPGRAGIVAGNPALERVRTDNP